MTRSFPQQPTMKNLPADEPRLEKITLWAISPEEENRLSFAKRLDASRQLVQGTQPTRRSPGR